VRFSAGLAFHSCITSHGSLAGPFLLLARLRIGSSDDELEDRDLRAIIYFILMIVELSHGWTSNLLHCPRTCPQYGIPFLPTVSLSIDSTVITSRRFSLEGRLPNYWHWIFLIFLYWRRRRIRCITRSRKLPLNPPTIRLCPASSKYEKAVIEVTLQMRYEARIY
jgi:hypothetical protein